jgi:hypothetical protein
MSYTGMKRHELVTKMTLHAASAEAMLLNAESEKTARGIEGSLIAANAHWLGAIFYQGELRENQP